MDIGLWDSELGSGRIGRARDASLRPVRAVSVRNPPSRTRADVSSTAGAQQGQGPRTVELGFRLLITSTVRELKSGSQQTVHGLSPIERFGLRYANGLH